MGIVSSTLAMAVLRLSWICQKLLDPRFSCIEGGVEIVPVSNHTLAPTTQVRASKQQTVMNSSTQNRATLAVEQSSMVVADNAKLPPAITNKSSKTNSLLHYRERNKLAAQLKSKTLPSSFDSGMMMRQGRCRKSSVPIYGDDDSSSTEWSSKSCDSESESRLCGNVSEGISNCTKLIGMSAEEEVAFRLTVGRGHFSRSKKDRFLKHLRLEKQLNDLNNEFIGIARRSHQRDYLERRHSGDLHRII